MCVHCSLKKHNNNVLTSPVVFLNSSARSPRTQEMFYFHVLNSVHLFPFYYNSDGKNNILLLSFNVWAGMWHVSKSRLLEGEVTGSLGPTIGDQPGQHSKTTPISKKKFFNPFLINLL